MGIGTNAPSGGQLHVTSGSNNAIKGVSSSNDGVQGETTSAGASGVAGFAHSAGTNGGYFSNDGGGRALWADGLCAFSRTSNTVATFSRIGSAGSVLLIQDDFTTVGTVSFDAAGLVTWGTFTGSHLAWTDQDVNYGELVCLTGVNRRWHERPNGEIVYGIAPSIVPNDPRCLGAHLGLLEPTESFSTDNPFQVASVGNGDMWVVDTGRNIEPGQYLISSDVKGHAMLDDESRFPVGYVVARVGEPVDWSKVDDSVDGHKHKKISVFFESFERGSAVAVGKSVAARQSEIDALKSRVAVLERAFTASSQSSRPVSLASIGVFAIPALALLGFVGLVVRGRAQNGGGR